MNPHTKCKICGSDTNLFDESLVLGKYLVKYYQCPDCQFIQTEESYWLEEAYKRVITKSDTQLALRNRYCAQYTNTIINNNFNTNGDFLDYGGGYGVFVSLARSLGLNFYWYDKFCRNIYAQNYVINDSQRKFELVTAFEVFEHFENPLEEIEKILQFSDNILFSTELLPPENPKVGDWWYYTPHEGQHISIYSLQSLKVIADKYNLNIYSNIYSRDVVSLHLLTAKKSINLNSNLEGINPKKECNLKIAFDIAVLGLSQVDQKAKTGIYTVITNILERLITSSELDLFLCCSLDFVFQNCENYLKDNFPELILWKLSDLRHLNISVYHSPFHPIPKEINFCRRLITIYDLIPINYPEFCDDYTPRSIKVILDSISESDYISCISESTRQDLIDYKQRTIQQENVQVIPLAANRTQFYSCQDEDKIVKSLEKYGIPTNSPYLLSVCTLEPRKNLISVIECFLSLKETGKIPDVKLVLVGTSGWKEGEIYRKINENNILQENVILTGYVDIEDLAPIYSKALSFIYLSKYEGFGLPPLEAMQCGTPVITSNNSSLPEVVGEAGIMLPPDDLDGLSNAIFELYTKPKMREELSVKSLIQAQKFTWEHTVQGTIDLYKLAVKTEPVVFRPKIIVDGVFLQLHQSGIVRLWTSLLREWAKTDFAKHIIILDRQSTAPRIPGIKYLTIPSYDYNKIDEDRTMLQRICDEEEASLFISSYYTTPIETPSIAMIYDLIPEVFNWDLSYRVFQEKQRAIEEAIGYITISNNTAKDLIEYYPYCQDRSITVAHCGSDPFTRSSQDEISKFKEKYGIDKPYFLITSVSEGYKNSALFFQGFAKLRTKSSFDIVCTGNHPLPTKYREYTKGSAVHVLNLDDSELQAAYSGAIALIYPSKYEGFGMPIVEAMACGIPTIVCPNSSLLEVAGSAAIYVGEEDVDGMSEALCQVQTQKITEQMVALGYQQAQNFRWEEMASTIANLTFTTIEAEKNNCYLYPNWNQEAESVVAEIEAKIMGLDLTVERTLVLYCPVDQKEAANEIVNWVGLKLSMLELPDLEQLKIRIVALSS